MGAIEATIDRIKQMLIDGVLGPGDKLPVEKDLAASLGVTRNTLREAVRALTSLKMLQTRQGDGTYVTSLQPSLLLDGMRRAGRAWALLLVWWLAMLALTVPLAV